MIFLNIYYTGRLSLDPSVFRLLVSNFMELGASAPSSAVINGHIDQYFMKIGF